MTKNKEEVWYQTNYPVPKPKKGFERFMDILSWMVGIAIVMTVIMAIFFL